MEATQSRLTPALTVTGVLCAVVAMYVVMYLAMLRPVSCRYRTMQVVEGRWMEVAWTDVQPEYLIGGPVSDWLFWPAHQIDRQIRKVTWGD